MSNVYSIQWKIPGQLCFQGKRKLLKNLECKTYIQYSEKFRAHSAFQGKRKFLKSPECKTYIQYSEKFQGKSVFQGEHKVAQKSWM